VRRGDSSDQVYLALVGLQEWRYRTNRACRHSSYLAELVTVLTAAPPKMILRNATIRGRDWLSERIHVSVVMLPIHRRHTRGEDLTRSLTQCPSLGRQMSALSAN